MGKFDTSNFLRKIKILGNIILDRRFRFLVYRIKTNMKGLDLNYVSLENLGLSADRSRRHEESGGPYLKKVLKTLDIQQSNRGIDLGSGKGGAVLTMGMFPFSEIVGVEISDDLVRIAEANVSKLGLTNVHFVSCDAGKFTDLDRFTHIYMYNPFPQLVMKEVMENLSASLHRKPRLLTLIYCLPKCHDVVMNSGLFTNCKQVKYRHSAYFYIYTSEIAAAAHVHPGPSEG